MNNRNSYCGGSPSGFFVGSSLASDAVSDDYEFPALNFRNKEEGKHIDPLYAE